MHSNASAKSTSSMSKRELKIFMVYLPAYLPTYLPIYLHNYPPVMVLRLTLLPSPHDPQMPSPHQRKLPFPQPHKTPSQQRQC